MSGDVRYCRSCGFEVLLDAQFCESCGTRLGPARREPGAASQPSPVPQAGSSAGGSEPTAEEATARRLARERERAAWRQRRAEQGPISFLEAGSGSARPHKSRGESRRPGTYMLLALLSWVVFRTFGYLPLVLLLKLLGLLMGPGGLAFLLLLAYLYSVRQRQIDALVRTFTRRVRAFRAAARDGIRSLAWVRQAVEQLLRPLTRALRGGGEGAEVDADPEDVPPDL